MLNNESDTIEFRCVNDHCDQIISFSVLKIEKNPKLKCTKCNKEYTFNKEFISKIGKFEKLVLAVHDAKDILGNTNVAIDLSGHNITVPYRLLLTRLNTNLTLTIGNEEVQFRFRIEPLKEEEEAQIKKR